MALDRKVQITLIDRISDLLDATSGKHLIYEGLTK